MLSKLQKRKLTKFFSMYDTNCNGYLAKKDFESFCKRLAGLRDWSLRSPWYVGLSTQLDRDWKALKDSADKDQDSKISLDEWLDYYDCLLNDPQKYEERVKSLMEMVFGAFDQNKAGTINLHEWAGLLSVYNVSPIYAPLAFERLQIDPSQVIDKDHMLTFIRDFFYSDDQNTPANGMFGPY